MYFHWPIRDGLFAHTKVRIFRALCNGQKFGNGFVGAEEVGKYGQLLTFFWPSAWHDVFRPILGLF